jgi:hypothetical protein
MPITATYDPFNHYWVRDDGAVFSSAARGLVAADDPDFEAWKAAGQLTTVWPRDDTGAQTDAALNDVLTPYGLAFGAEGARQAAIADVLAYEAQKSFDASVRAQIEAAKPAELPALVAKLKAQIDKPKR